MLCCCERDEQTSSRIMSDYNIDLGEWGVSSVPALMAKTWNGALLPNSIGWVTSMLINKGEGLVFWFVEWTTAPSNECLLLDEMLREF